MTVVTGFLGSGKTTLLGRLLASPGARDIAVLVNEMAEIGIDQKLLAASGGDVRLLKNGCICCAVQEDLRRGLMDLLESATGRSIARVVIETTGLADPVPILNTFARDPVLRHQLRIGSIVTVVDGVNAMSQRERYREWTAQVAAADRIVLTKADLANAGAVDAVNATLDRLNPAAPVFSSAMPDESLAAAFLDESPGMADPAARFRRLLAAGSPALRLDRGGIRGPDQGRHEPSVTPFCICVEGAFDWSAFAVWLAMLLHAHGDNVLRVKGILNIADAGTPLAINGVRHLIHRPMHLERWPDEERRSQLVFIVSGLDPEGIRRSFETFVGAAADAEVELAYF